MKTDIKPKNLLLVTLAFPPKYGAGVHRIIRLCKYLNKINYIPTVLTSKSEKSNHSINEFYSGYKGDIFRAYYKPLSAWFGVNEPSMKIFYNDKAISSPNLEPKSPKIALTVRKLLNPLWVNIVEIPDKSNTWIRGAIKLGLKAYEKREYHLIYSSSPDVSAHFVASSLAQKLNLPWVMEYRDLWIDNPWHRKKYFPRKQLDSFFEKKLVKRANKIITVTQGNATILINRHNDEIAQKVNIIPNGFDPDEHPLNVKEPSSFPISLFYSGSFYSRSQDITGLLAAIKLLSSKYPNINNLLKFRIAGDLKGYAIKTAYQFGLQSFVDSLGQLNHPKTLELQASSHLLLLIGSGKDSLFDKSIATSKIYEYLGAKRPILALASQDSIIANIISSTNTGEVFHPQDSQNIAAFLDDTINQFKETRKIKYSPIITEIKKYEWSNIIKKVEPVLNSLLY